jgi:hypothetical protein
MLDVASCSGAPRVHIFIPDLVFNVNQIVLCHVCAENSMTKDQESIAMGKDYGRVGSLKQLNGTTQNACVPV